MHASTSCDVGALGAASLTPEGQGLAPSPWRLRPFQPTDTPALIALWQRCGLTRPWNDPALDIARKCADSPELLGVLTLGEGGPLIGSVMAGYEGHRGWINYLAVSPEHQRQGAGRWLMAWAEARLRERGCPKINLQVRRGNAAVLGFYRALGFVEDDLVSLGRRLVEDPPLTPNAQAEPPGSSDAPTAPEARP